MKKLSALLLAVLFASQAHAWGFVTGAVDVYYVNTYGNYSETDLNGGFCFKLVGSNYYFKIPYSDAGEKKNNLLLAQTMVTMAFTTGRQVHVSYVDWGADTTCRVVGALMPARFVENLRVLN